MKINILVIIFILASITLFGQLQFNTIETSFQPFLSSNVKIDREYEDTKNDLNAYHALSYMYSIASRFTFKNRYHGSLGLSYTHYNYSLIVNFDEAYMRKIGWAETDYFSILKNFVRVWEIGINPSIHYSLLDKQKNKIFIGCGVGIKYPLRAFSRGSLSYESNKVFEFSGKINKHSLIFITPKVHLDYERLVKNKFWVSIKFQFVLPLYKYFRSNSYTIYASEILSGNFYAKNGGVSLGLGLIYRFSEKVSDSQNL